MRNIISNTSPLLYLYRIGALDLLPKLFDEVWTPEAVKNELNIGRMNGYDVPNLAHYQWVKIINPKLMPSEWLALDLGAGELAAMALALENRDRIVLLDDMLARRTAHERVRPNSSQACAAGGKRHAEGEQLKSKGGSEHGPRTRKPEGS